MPFPWTLQRYIFSEMSKTFLLAAVALTGVLGLGGGVLNMIKLGEVTPGQLARLMLLVLPLAAALTLPVAALFSATSTYGRLSADNEFVACRSSGINMHLLFLPTVVVSLLAASVSFVFTNFVIPSMVRNLNEFIGSDVGVLVRQRLKRPQGITLPGGLRIHADEVLTDPQAPDRVTLRQVAFVEVDGDQWVRFGTAREVVLDFDSGRPTGKSVPQVGKSAPRTRVSGQLAGLSYYDHKRGQFFEEDQQAIPPNDVPSAVPPKIKFLNAGELLYYFSRPTEWHEVRQEIQRLRRATAHVMVYDELWKDWIDDKSMTLSDKHAVYTIQAEQGALVPGGRGIDLGNVVIKEHGSGRRITAERATLAIPPSESLSDGGVRIELYQAHLSDGSTDWKVGPTRTIARAKVTLGPVAIPPAVIARIDAMTDDELLNPPTATPGDPLVDMRAGAEEEKAQTVRKIIGAISERMAFAVSVFVLVILGATLGIVFRGSHVMTAFGISFVPGLVVIITIVMGRQMSHNAATHVLGLLVMWSGITFVAGLDGWTLTRTLRR